MQQFTITKEYRTTFTYVVDAESADEALHMVRHGNIGGTINRHLDAVKITSTHDFTLR